MAFYWAEPHDCWCTCITASSEINLKWTAGHLLWMSVLVLLSFLKGPLDFAVVANNWNSFHSVRMRSRSQWVWPGTSTSRWTVPSLISHWQGITPKRSPNHQETREKLEKISSVSLGHAKSRASQPLPALYALCKLPGSWPTSSCPLAALAAPGKNPQAPEHSQTSQKSPQSPVTFRDCGWILPEV